MNEIPVSPQPFRYSIPDDSFDPIRKGIGLGVRTATIMAGLYALVVPLLYALVINKGGIPSTPANLHDTEAVLSAMGAIYVNAIMYSVISFVIGGIPAIFVGVVGGAGIGAIFRFWIKRQLPSSQAISYGFWISLLLLVIRLFFGGVITGFSLSVRDYIDPYYWMVWMAPNLIAFFGFWWVAYEINQKRPTS